MSTDSSQKMFCICKYNLSILKMYQFTSLNVSVSSNDTSIFLTLSSVVNVLTEWYNLLVCILGVVDYFTRSYFIHSHFCGYFKKTTLNIFLSIYKFVLLHNTQNTFLYCHE